MSDAAGQSASQRTMQCMEVWGGNQAVDNGVVMPGLDAWVYSRPYEGDVAGGDIHYVSSCATGRIIRILVADVSGHGNEVAEVAAALRGLMRRFINYVDQTRLVRGLNTEFAGLAEAGRFATAVVATFWSPTDELKISNAGHPRPLIYRAGAGRWEAMRDEQGGGEGLANIPLGIAEPTRYDEMSVRLSRGDLVLLYTDSLIEAMGPDGRQLGQEGLARALSGLDPAKPEALIPALLETVVRYGGGEPLGDDVTALLLRPNAIKTRSSIGAGLSVGLRLSKEFLLSLTRAERFPWPQICVRNLAGIFFGRFNRWGRSRKARRDPGQAAGAPPAG